VAVNTFHLDTVYNVIRFHSKRYDVAATRSVRQKERKRERERECARIERETISSRFFFLISVKMRMDLYGPINALRISVYIGQIVAFL